ncbi:MAG TPA: hypothetical protein DEH02_22210, partial [Bacteroidales bacterium]|nr:hypothetical protein [Bacteroidales bacterium]
HFLRQPGGKICRKAIAVAKSSLISIAPLKGFEAAPQLVANGPRIGAVFLTLDLPACPTGLGFK